MLLLNRFKQGNLMQGKVQPALKKWKNVFGDQRKDRLNTLVVSIDLFCFCFVSFSYNGTFLTNYDVICRKLKHIVTDSIVEKRTK